VIKVSCSSLSGFPVGRVPGAPASHLAEHEFIVVFKRFLQGRVPAVGCGPRCQNHQVETAARQLQHVRVIIRVQFIACSGQASQVVGRLARPGSDCSGTVTDLLYLFRGAVSQPAGTRMHSLPYATLAKQARAVFESKDKYIACKTGVQKAGHSDTPWQ
jgi:hypothetical protein